MREEKQQYADYTDDAMTVQIADYQNAHLYNVLNSDDGRGLKSEEVIRTGQNKTDLSIE
jgi:hypothetical protein